MLKQLKAVIFANALLSLLFILSNYFIWNNLIQWSRWNMSSDWSPLFIAPYRIPDAPTVQMPVPPQLNIPFMLFWIMLAVNIYYIVKLQRSEDTKPAQP